MMETGRRRGRSIGNILGYMVSVAFLIITITFAGLSSFGTNSALEYTGAQFIGFIYSTPGPGDEIRFNNPDHEGFLVYNYPVVLFPVEIVDQVRNSPNVKHAAPMITFTVITDEYVDRSWILSGFDPSDMESVRMASCSDTDIVDGRLIEPGDTGVVLLEQTFADAEQYGIGDIIYFGDMEFSVLGILSPGTRPAKADIYMAYDEAIEVLNTRINQPVKNVANVVLVDGGNSLVNLAAQNDVKEILGFNSSTIGYGCFNPAGTAIGITMRGMRLLGMIVLISILLMILASQYYMIVERRNDIGVLKAIGWSDRNVVYQVMSESLIQSAIGATAGSIAALLLFSFFPVGQWLGIDPSFSISMNPLIIIYGFLLTVLAGTIAGAFSAFISLRLKPADILRRL